MSNKNVLEKVKKLRELTGVGFNDCKNAIEENNGDIDKSIEFLRKKGIAKANKKMDRIAGDGLISISEKENKFSIIEVNSETDFVAKNEEFKKFVEEISNISLLNSGRMNDILNSQMKNKKNVQDNLISIIAKIGEKITIRRSDFIDSKNSVNFSYTHMEVKKNLGKIGVLLSLETSMDKRKLSQFGKQLAMHIAASSPLSIDMDTLDHKIIEKEKEIITEELKNSGKNDKIIDKIAAGKFNRFISENTLLNQEWIMDPKKKVKDIIKEITTKEKIVVKKFVRFKVGEGI